MRVLLTGGNGMVGRNIIEHGLSAEHEISAPSSAELDLRDADAVDSWIKNVSPDLIIHAAGIVGGIQANLQHPVSFLLDNVDIARNVIWCARKNEVKKLINFGSSCMYPRDAPNPLDEEMILKGELEPSNEGYALAKIFSTRLCEYISTQDASYLYKTLIPCNIYGRHDKFDPAHSHMLPAIIHKLHIAKISRSCQIDIWGDGTARREFMYASDLADCVWRAADEFVSMPTVMNVGLGHDYTVNEYYRIAADIIGYEGEFVHDLSKPVGMNRKLVNVDRLSKWGWRAKTNIESGIMKTYTFYMENKVDE